MCVGRRVGGRYSARAGVRRDVPIELNTSQCPVKKSTHGLCIMFDPWSCCDAEKARRGTDPAVIAAKAGLKAVLSNGDRIVIVRIKAVCGNIGS